MKHRKRHEFRLTLAALSFLFALTTSAQQPDRTTSTNREAAVPLDVFQGPKMKRPEVVREIYPPSEKSIGHEGWVSMSMMVDSSGKPFEVTVSGSSGSKAFEKVALEYAGTLRFVPASLNGQPVESEFNTKVTFSVKKKPTREFLNSLADFDRAMQNKDRAAADLAIGNLHVNSLHEDAYFGLVRYEYASQWGTDDEQLAGIARAIAGEPYAGYLSKEKYIELLKALTTLQVKMHDYAGALNTWRRLQVFQLDEATTASLKPSLDEIEARRHDDQPYVVAGKITDQSWYFGLFKRRFHIDVSNGRISQIKLRCDKKYVFFQFDPTLEYRVGDTFGVCSIEVVGDPETNFKLVQS